LIYLSTLLLSLFITIALIPLFSRMFTRLKVLDMPDERKVHTHPIPRSGGIAMVIGAFIPIMLWAPTGGFLFAYAVGVGIIVLVGLFDDLKTLGYKAKFAGQIAAAIVVVIYGIKIKSLGAFLPDYMVLPDWIAIPFTVFVIVGVTNAVNLADGLDGLAGGICLLSLCCIAYLGYMDGEQGLAIMSIALAGAIFGFLRFNTYPADLFMGDTGSQFLGFSIVTFSLSLTQDSTPLSPLLPLTIVGFVVLDTLAVMAERIAEGRTVFSADKNHFHHKLMRLGFSHTESVLTIYIIQTVLVVSAYFFRFYSEWFLLSGYLILSAVILTAFAVAQRTGWKLRRFHFLDIVVKGRVKILKDKGFFIKSSFTAVEILIPALLISATFLSESYPPYLPVLAAILLGSLLLAMKFKREWLRGSLMLAVYLFIPFAVYYSEESRLSHTIINIYNAFYAALVFLIIATLKMTRRKRGFKSTPTDFLILFIVLIVPYILTTYFEGIHIGPIVAKTVVLFFSYEVLIGELRGNVVKAAWAFMAALAVVIIRGIV
jgi:UDP-GlcNAc:undecaprenyl-phosphate GlcNAc-1-phosphate transferase